MFTKISFVRLLILAILLTVAAQAIHETGHMIVYQSFHRNPTWGFIGLVQRWDSPPLTPDHWVTTSTPNGEKGWLRLDTMPEGKAEKGSEAAAGPIASLLAVILGLFAAYKSNKSAFRHICLMLALSISFSMVLYYLRSPLRTIGDEYEIATQMSIVKAMVEIPFALSFIVCLVFGLRILESWRIRLKWLGAILLGSMTAGVLLMIADGWIRESVNKGNPYFQSVLGYSLPVLVIYLLAFSGIFVWQYKIKNELIRP